MHDVSRRFVFLAVLTLLTLPIVYYSVSFLRAPELFAADELVTRDCRICAGTGTDEQMAMDYPELGSRCRFCRGDGKVDVIVPGPNRPTRLRGSVRDSSQLDDLERWRGSVKGPHFGGPDGRSTQKPFARPKGALAGVRIELRRGAETLSLESNPHGYFTARLTPGAYSVTVSAAGFRSLESEFEVPALTEPIWLEEAKLIREPETAAEARSLYGLEMQVLLAREGKGTIQVFSGGP